MNTIRKQLTLTAVLAAVAILLFLKSRDTGHSSAEPGAADRGMQESALPALVELGADKCIPCKMMAPILAELKTDYADRLQVEFIDVWKYPEAAGPYNVRIIPLQIFFDGNGQELFRHEGFFAKEDILAKWKELGYDFQ